MDTSPIPAPDGLRERGQVAWGQLTAKYDFRPDELIVLERACRALDLIASMESEIAAHIESTGVLTTIGSTGQIVTHPLVAEIRAQSSAVASMMKQLKIPDDENSTVPAAGERSSSARKAAQSRWGLAHGKGA